MTAIDLCCGAGGLSRGLLDAGIEVVLGVDNWPSALRVFAKNLKVPTLRADLARLPRLPRVDLICGGPPCQDFSTAGKQEEGSRARLTETFASIVGKERPRFVVYENVKAANKAASYQRAKSHLGRCGYGLTEVVLDASLYGVPQRRQRLLLVGVLGGQHDELQEVLLSGKSSSPMTVREYCDSVGLPLSIDHHYASSRYYGRKNIWSIDEPAPTIRSGSRFPVRPDYPGHSTDSTTDLRSVRALSIREASLVQTFPASWDWGDVMLKDAWVMLANAVPPKLGMHLGRTLLAV